MAADVAEIGLSVTSDSVRVANDNLRQMAREATAAERAAQRWSSGARSAAQQTSLFARAVEALRARFTGVSASASKESKGIDILGMAIKRLIALYLAFDVVHRTFDAAFKVADLDETAEQVGLTARNFQALQYQAVQSGVKIEELEVGLSKFSRTMGDASNGNKEAIESLDKLGVKIIDMRGNLIGTDEALVSFAKSIMSIEDPAKRAAAVVTFFGRSGTRFLPLLASIAEGFDKMGAEAQNAGAIADRDLIARLDKAADTLARFGLVVRVALAEAAAFIIQSAEKLAGWFDRVLPPDGKTFQQRIDSWVHPIEDFIDRVHDLENEAIANAIGWVAGMGTAFSGLKDVIVRAFGEAINSGLSTLEEGLNKIPKRLKELFGGEGKAAINLGRVDLGKAAGATLEGAKVQSEAAAKAARETALAGMTNNAAERARQRELTRQAGMQEDEERARAIPLGGVSPPGVRNPPPKASGESPYAKALEGARDYIAAKKAETEAVGKSVLEAARLTHQQDLVNKATQEGTVLTTAQRTEIAGLAEQMAQADAAFASAKFMDDFKTKTDAAIASQQIEQDTLYMGKEAALAYKLAQDAINDAIQRGIDLKPAQIAAINEAAAAQAAITTQVQNSKEWVDLAKQSVKGFVQDMVSGLREGKSVWESFGNAALGVLDKITSKLLDMAVDSLFSSKGGGGGGLGSIISMGASFIGSLFGGGSFFPTMARGGVLNHGNVVPFASGGVVGGPAMFPLSGGRRGLMGEAGPEAVMPLRRRNGRLGVEASVASVSPRIVIEVAADSEWVRATARDESGQEIARSEEGIVRKAVRRSNRMAPSVVSSDRATKGGDYRRG